MKKLNKKSLLLLICATLLLTFTVSGTVAFLADNDGPVKNTFTPADVDTEITEEVENGTKSKIVITNAADSIDVYVRVAVVGNWVITKDNVDTVVEGWTPTTGQYNSSDWFENGGFYYYKYVVNPGQATSNLLAQGITSTTREDGAHLEITVIHQSIQAKPKTAVSDAWGSTIASNLSDTTKPAE